MTDDQLFQQLLHDDDQQLRVEAAQALITRYDAELAEAFDGSDDDAQIIARLAKLLPHLSWEQCSALQAATQAAGISDMVFGDPDDQAPRG